MDWFLILVGGVFLQSLLLESVILYLWEWGIFLDPNDSNLTIEGLPAPKRAVFVCQK